MKLSGYMTFSTRSLNNYNTRSRGCEINCPSRPFPNFYLSLDDLNPSDTPVSTFKEP